MSEAGSSHCNTWMGGTQKGLQAHPRQQSAQTPGAAVSGSRVGSGTNPLQQGLPGARRIKQFWSACQLLFGLLPELRLEETLCGKLTVL